MRSTPFAALNVEGREPLPAGAGGAVAWRYITPGYFAALAIPMRRGRAFTEEDRTPQASSIVLSESLARRLFANEDPVGRRIFRTKAGWHTVIGVAGDVRNNGSDAEVPEYYAVRKHTADEVFGDGSAWRGATIVARGSFQPAAIRAALAELDPALPVTFQSMRERVGELTERPRFNALLLAGFALCGLTLAAIGIYSLVAFLVTQRTREVGVRMAMGATPAAITRQFLWNAARWTLAGVALGGAVSIPAARWMGATLDVASFAPAAGLLTLVALTAACVPARRAARIDPAQCLRQD
jgi:hypothetical protein